MSTQGNVPLQSILCIPSFHSSSSILSQFPILYYSLPLWAPLLTLFPFFFYRNRSIHKALYLHHFPHAFSLPSLPLFALFFILPPNFKKQSFPFFLKLFHFLLGYASQSCSSSNFCNKQYSWFFRMLYCLFLLFFFFLFLLGAHAVNTDFSLMSANMNGLGNAFKLHLIATLITSCLSLVFC